MTGFRIPFACDANERLVAPGDAARGQRYTCPACGARVDLHAGEIKRRHFHHRKAACSLETVTHLLAKKIIVRAVEEWKAGGPPVVFRRRCAEPACERRTAMEIPKKVRRVAEEWRLPSGHTADVALLGPGDLPIAAIEVKVTHAVDDAKERELGLPWIEVAGADVCATAGRVLEPVRDHFLPWLCAEHTARRGMARREQLADDRLKKKLVRELGYDLADFPGYRIEGVTRCASGHDTLVLGWTGKQPPWPRPPHVVTFEAAADALFDRTSAKVRRVLPFRRQWASVCTTCGARVAMTE